MSLTSKVSRLESEIRSKDISIASLQNQLAECEYCNRCFSVSISPATLTASTGADHTLNYTLYLHSDSCGGCGRTLNIPIILTYDYNTSGSNVDRFGLQASSSSWCCN